jgi:hypothetical protein
MSESREVIQIVPPRRGGAITVSILRRDLPAPPSVEEAVEITEAFVREQGADTSIEPTVITSVYEARAQFVIHDLLWEVRTLVDTGNAIVCSYCHDGSDAEALAVARQILAAARLE